MNKIQTGIWLDFKDAFIVTFEGGAEAAIKHIHSKVKHQATKGGSRSKSPWGPQFSPPDDTMLERDKHAEHHYFQQVLEIVNPEADELVIFGPAQAKLGLKKEIEHIKHYKPKLLGVFPSDYITQHELVALMKDFFRNPGEYIKNDEAES